MSTKIYNGIVIDTTNLHEVMRIVDNFRPFVQRESEKMMDRFFAGVPDESTAWQLWLQCQKEAKAGKRLTCCDTEFSLLIFPPYHSQFYGIVYTDQPDWFDAFLDQPLVSEYGYWNNSDDYPDGVTEADWQVRRRTWDEIVGERTPSMSGFSVDVADPNGPLPKAMRTPVRVFTKS